MRACNRLHGVKGQSCPYNALRGIVGALKGITMNVARARAVLPWCGVLAKDSQGRIDKVYVPASPIWKDKHRGTPRHAIVTLARSRGTITLDCRCCNQGDGAEPEPCLGMERGLCYHALAALLVAADGIRLDIHPPSNKSHWPGKSVLVRAAYGPGEAVAVIS